MCSYLLSSFIKSWQRYTTLVGNALELIIFKILQQTYTEWQVTHYWPPLSPLSWVDRYYRYFNLTIVVIIYLGRPCYYSFAVIKPSSGRLIQVNLSPKYFLLMVTITIFKKKMSTINLHFLTGLRMLLHWDYCSFVL